MTTEQSYQKGDLVTLRKSEPWQYSTPGEKLVILDIADWMTELCYITETEAGEIDLLYPSELEPYKEKTP